MNRCRRFDDSTQASLFLRACSNPNGILSFSFSPVLQSLRGYPGKVVALLRTDGWNGTIQMERTRRREETRGESGVSLDGEMGTEKFGPSLKPESALTVDFLRVAPSREFDPLK